MLMLVTVTRRDQVRVGAVGWAADPRDGDTGMVTPARTRAFVPSDHAFAFANDWPAVPAVSVPLVIGSIGIGNAARGLCGGMVFAALDYWHARVVPPPGRPDAGTPMFRFVVRRLVASWCIPAGVGRYYRWMWRSDADLARRTILRQWPAVRASLDAGAPAALGVVTVASANPLLLGANHQVLAYGYSIAGTEITLRVYDPNRGPDDTICIRFREDGHAFSHNLGLERPVRGFFVTRYARAGPPAG
jgi:hypothetical protein